MSRRHVAVIGMMAVGKSTTARRLAERLGARFVDVDDIIEAQTGRTVRELADEGGEQAYRALERAVVETALAAEDSVVLATPGGVAVDEAMAAAVRTPGITTVYLRAGLDTLVRHVDGGADRRPLLGDDPRAALSRLLDARAGRYEALADHVVDVDGRTPDEVVAAALDALGG
jgi:shikimate kinase